MLFTKLTKKNTTSSNLSTQFGENALQTTQLSQIKGGEEPSEIVIWDFNEL